MKNFTIATCILSCSLTLILPAGVNAADPEPAQNTNDDYGTIILLDKDNKKCTIALPPPTTGRVWEYDFDHIGLDCEDNTAEKIIFTNIPSATKILLADTSFCARKLAPKDHLDFFKSTFWVEFKTTKNHFSTPYDPALTLETIAIPAKNKIVTPGLQMLDKELFDGVHSLRESLSCIRITTSAPNIPPSPLPVQLSEPAWEDAGSSFSYIKTCDPNEVIGDIKLTEGDNRRTLITCQKVLHNSIPLSVTNESWKKGEIHNNNVKLVCDEDSMITGIEHSQGRHLFKVRCGKVHDNNNNNMIVVNDSSWGLNPPTSESCPGNQVLVGERVRYDSGVPFTAYHRCATLIYPVATPTQTTP
ncbi:hypothetical protein [Pseudomonas sp. CCC3.1]|uniref:hypothetical protein n=1 Tax=Pseudomonas sp. CCC3.1 TaxID=3048607 RepID=UPI002AC90E21|nr:hypothetical protein [Pseudomonas sp. CCC3.1]MEB0208011.1 hypothetical protein [Pseudomonas sp. CCC3.1]WPX37660.1 hypothetical protein RHM56_05605 [Pseudomonas sp. CCC3.1]